MNQATIARILDETAYVRIGGTAAEKKAAEYIAAECAKFGCKAELQPFEVGDVDDSLMKHCRLLADGKEIPCKGYLLCGSGTVEAPFQYLPDPSPLALSRCRGKIVLLDTGIGYWVYRDLLAAGVAGIITYDGNLRYTDRDIDQKELREYVALGEKTLCVNINAKDAVPLVRDGVQTVRIEIEQEERRAFSHNVVLELPGETEEAILFTAHYDSTPLSVGAYDNMTGSIALLSMAEYFASHPHRRTLRFVWCGSEERGLYGSKAYCAQHPEQVEKTVLNINIDMIGSIMGKFNAHCTTEDTAIAYLNGMAKEQGVVLHAFSNLHSSDCIPLSDQNVPAYSFARSAPNKVAVIHERYDTKEVLSPKQLEEDIAFITHVADRMANAVCMPFERKISEKMRERIEEYMGRKRPKA